jgi:hypothetical protein
MLVSATFARGALLNGGVTLGRTTFDLCWHNDLPQVSQAGSNSGAGATPVGFPRQNPSCRVQSALWGGIGSQIKVQGVYPLPLSFTVSGTYKNVPGVPITALHVVTNNQARASLGRDLSACRGAVPCTATAVVELLPAVNNSGNSSATKYDERVSQINLRLTRAFRINQGRVQAVAELYNVLNERPAQGSLTTYGGAWLRPTALLGGRLFKFGAQVDW